DRLRPLPPSPPVPLEVLASVGERVGGAQRPFDATGGVHAAGASDATGEPGGVREARGRHNAVAQGVGRRLLDRALPATGPGLWVSGRASFEIVQKAWAAGLATVVAVSAPTSLAVEAARLGGVTLCGFARDGRLNVYAGEGVVAP